MARTIRGKVTLLLVNRRSVLLLAAAAANIDSARCQSQQRPVLTCLDNILNKKEEPKGSFSHFSGGR